MPAEKGGKQKRENIMKIGENRDPEKNFKNINPKNTPMQQCPNLPEPKPDHGPKDDPDCIPRPLPPKKPPGEVKRRSGK
jgi:hypothetical protein